MVSNLTEDERQAYGLTDDEHKAIGLTADLWNLLCASVVGDGPSRAGDLAELCHHVHAIQRTVMAQAAARAYPERYRLLGSVVQPAAEITTHADLARGERVYLDEHGTQHAEPIDPEIWMTTEAVTRW